MVDIPPKIEKVKFKNADGENEMETDVNIRDPFSGKNENVFSVKLPENMTAAFIRSAKSNR